MHRKSSVKYKKLENSSTSHKKYHSTKRNYHTNTTRSRKDLNFVSKKSSFLTSSSSFIPLSSSYQCIPKYNHLYQHPHKSRYRAMSSVPNVSGDVGDIVPFHLADIGEGIFEVAVLQWFVTPGDKISQFQKICEVQSDKANVEISSRFDGIVEDLAYKIGEMAKVGSPLMKIKLTTPVGGISNKNQNNNDNKNTHNDSKSTQHEPQNKNQQQNHAPSCLVAKAEENAAANKEIIDAIDILNKTQRPESEILASPSVRMYARQNNINLGFVTPTGIRGQITKEDLNNYLLQLNKQQDQSIAPVSSINPIQQQQQQQHADIVSRTVTNSESDKIINITGIQKVMVKTMTAASLVPTLGFGDEIVVDELVKLRKNLQPIAAQYGVKITPFVFIIKALSLALNKYPQMNSIVINDCTQVIEKKSHNIGIAMDTPKGLLVPNIKDVQNKSILEIAKELNRLQASGAEGKLSQHDLSNGTITLSNVGNIGGTYCSPVLVVPQVAIAAFGKFHTKANFDKNGQVYPSTVMNVGWTADHRIIDGATVARFNNEMKSYIENPQSMVLF